MGVCASMVPPFGRFFFHRFFCCQKLGTFLQLEPFLLGMRDQDIKQELPFSLLFFVLQLRRTDL